VSVSVALLRAVNVGGRNLVPMADLRATFETLGFAGVRTYVQSGNVVFRHPGRASDALARRIEATVAARFGSRVQIMLRTAAELGRALGDSPFASQAARNPATVHIGFLSRPPANSRALDTDAERVAPDRFVVRDREIHLWYPNGLGRSKLTNALIERRLGVSATSRNWNTVTKLHELASE